MTIAIGIVIVAISILVGFLVYFKVSDSSLDRVHEARKELYESNSKLSKFIRLKPKTYNKLQVYLSKIGVNYLKKGL